MNFRHTNLNGKHRNSARTGRRLQAAAARPVEMLESRTMMSGVTGTTGGIVVVHVGPPAPIVSATTTTVLGTAGNDVIDVVPGATSGSVKVTVDGFVEVNQSWSSLGSDGLVIDGKGGSDKVNIGNGNLSSFTRNILVQDTGGTDTATVDDHADNANRTVAQTCVHGDHIITGIAPGTISFNKSQTTSITIKLGNGNDTVHAGAGDQDIIVGNGQDFLYGGSGHDTLTTGTGNDTIVTIGDGPAQINGGGGINSYWIDSGTSQKISDPLIAVDEFYGNVHTVSSYQKLVVDYVQGGTTSQTPPRGPMSSGLLEPDPTVINSSNVTVINGYQDFSGNPLFAPGGPTQNDVRQGGIGDCGFFAGIAGYANVNPNWIQQSIVSLGDGTYAVRFFRTPTDPVYYRIDANLPVNGGYYVAAGPGVDNCIWAPLLEKAFAFYRLGQGSYQSIQGGGCITALNSVGLGYDHDPGAQGDQCQLDNISNGLKAGGVVVAGTVLTPTPADYVIGSHCYTVESVKFCQGKAGQHQAARLPGASMVPASTTTPAPLEP